MNSEIHGIHAWPEAHAWHGHDGRAAGEREVGYLAPQLLVSVELQGGQASFGQWLWRWLRG